MIAQWTEIFFAKLQTLLGERGVKGDSAVRWRDLGDVYNVAAIRATTITQTAVAPLPGLAITVQQQGVDITQAQADIANAEANIIANANSIVFVNNSLGASITDVGESVQGFQKITDEVADVVVGAAVAVTLGAANAGQTGTIIVTEGATARVTTGTTNGASIPIPVARALLFAGQRIKIGVLASRAPTNFAARFGVAYASADGSSGFMLADRDLTATPEWFAFHYQVPAVAAGGAANLGIFGDNLKTGKGTRVYRVFIEIAAVVGELPEVTTLQGDIVDIKALDLSALTGTAFGTLLTQLNVNAGGTSATVSTQSSAIATLEGNAAASITFRAKAGSGGALLELVAASNPTGGAGSVARIAATDIILQGSVLADRLTIRPGNMISDAQLATGVFADWRPYTNPQVQNVVSRTSPGVPAGAPTAFVARFDMNLSTSAVVSTFAGKFAFDIAGREASAIPVIAGQPYLVSLDWCQQGGAGVMGITYAVYWLMSDGTSAGPVQVFDGTAPLTWTTSGAEVVPPDGAVGAWPFVYGYITSGAPGPIFWGNAKMREMTTGQLTVDGAFSVSGMSVFGGSLQSSNFVSGSAGWQITQAGSAEFNDLLVRGSLKRGAATSERIMRQTLGSPVSVTTNGSMGISTIIPGTTISLPVGHFEVIQQSAGLPVNPIKVTGKLRLNSTVAVAKLVLKLQYQSAGAWNTLPDQAEMPFDFGSTNNDRIREMPFTLLYDDVGLANVSSWTGVRLVANFDDFSPWGGGPISVRDLVATITQLNR